jgi:Pathogenicity locus
VSWRQPRAFALRLHASAAPPRGGLTQALGPMHPDKVERQRVKLLTDLPNVGPACAKDLQLLGINSPIDLRGKDPLEMYRALCNKTGVRQDLCVLDVLISITRFINGDPPQPWWFYTAERKKSYGTL